MALSIMQLLSVLLNAKYNHLFNYYFRIFKLVLGLLFEHTLITYHFFILKIYQKHIIMGITFFSQLPRSLPKFLTRLPFTSTCFDNLTCRGSDSHFILNNC